jgi:hypothetical protein
MWKPGGNKSFDSPEASTGTSLDVNKIRQLTEQNKEYKPEQPRDYSAEWIEKNLEIIHSRIESAARRGEHSTSWELFEDGPTSWFKPCKQKIWSGEVIGLTDPNNLQGEPRVVYESLIREGFSVSIYYGKFTVTW